ncbi:plant/protein [Tasmannia lanceolata]|uniref:plant/protein n=1 Tax=Tasmannia lanceolata TaxID=3420 RepID=UPI004063004E
MSTTLVHLGLPLPHKTLQNSTHSPSIFSSNLPLPHKSSLSTKTHFSKHPHQPQILLVKQLHKTINQMKISPLPITTLALPFFLDPQDALAVGGEFGLLEGRTLALVHPLVMASLFFYTLWAGYLGWQWRRVRTIQDEINELKKQVKPPPAVGSEGTTATAVAVQVSPVETKIQQLTEERKLLLKGSFRERHFNAGSILLAFGVFESVGGGVNTWFRTGKLFPGPHLFAGAAITVLWAAAAGLVPAMQKGNETARSLHIALNALNVLLFVWQIPTGIDIVFRVFEFTNWP